MIELKVGDKFTLLPPNALESYTWFYLTKWSPMNKYESHIFTVIWKIENWYIIAKNLNASFRPEYDSIKDTFIIKLLECWKVVLLGQ